MSTPRLKSNPLAGANTQALTKQTHGIELSAIRYVSPKTLFVNPLNEQFFTAEKERYFEELREDIEERGILVPLIARRDGILLAGHNRLRVAQMLDLPAVPVQFVEQDLDGKSEREFVIKDNLVRRQLTAEQRTKLYEALYENFYERIALRHEYGTPKNMRQETAIQPLTAKRIADDTGQKVNSVQKQLQQYDKQMAETARRSQEEIAVFSVERSPEMLRARERAAERNVTMSLEEIRKQITRDDVSAEWQKAQLRRMQREAANLAKMLGI